MATHEFTTRHTTTALEARDTVEDPLCFRMDPNEVNKYVPGAGALVTSKDGDIFIAEVSDVEDEDLRLYVTLR